MAGESGETVVASPPPRQQGKTAAAKKANGALMTRDEILGIDDIRHRDVFVPQWGRTVRLIAATAGERDAIETAILAEQAAGGRVNVRARWVATLAIDGDGNRLFTDADIAALAKKSGGALDRLYAACLTMNAVSDADIEELEKN